MEKDLKVLIVDDNTEVRNDLRLIINLIDGVKVADEASDRKEAIQKAAEHSPDLVIMDLEMGSGSSAEMEGIRTIRVIKNSNGNAIIFVLTVHDYDAARQAAFRSGADSFFVKGIEINDMLNAIRKLRTKRSGI